MAAVASIKNFMTVLQAHDSISETAPELLGVYLALYNALIDDDEEVRDQASVVVSSLLSASSASKGSEETKSVSLSPLAANPRLLQFLVLEYNTSICLWSEAVKRLTGASPYVIVPRWEVADLQLRPVGILLQEAMRTDNALFAEEKQNLFVDEVKEAEMWTGVLADLQPQSEPISKQTFRTWTLDGISALTAMIKDNVDGPLGWTSKPEVFTIGIRIILAARLIIHGPGMNDSSTGKEKCRESLRAFLDVGLEKEVHALWLHRIEETLAIAPGA